MNIKFSIIIPTYNSIDTLDATLNNLTIVITKNDVTVDSDTNAANNIFEGNYIKVEALFDDRAGESGKEATGVVTDGGLSATLDTKASDEATGQYVWVKIIVTVIGSFTSETTHGINIHFNAESK